VISCDDFLGIINRLTDIQLTVFTYIFYHCKKWGQLKTKKIQASELKELLTGRSFKSGSLKTTISRLSKKKLLIRMGGKRGRGGFYMFELKQPAYRAFSLYNTELEHNKDTIRTPKGTQ